MNPNMRRQKAHAEAEIYVWALLGLLCVVVAVCWQMYDGPWLASVTAGLMLSAVFSLTLALAGSALIVVVELRRPRGPQRM